MDQAMILAGDIGGTKTRLGWLRARGEELELVQSAEFPSKEHASLEEIVRAFVFHEHHAIDACCFGIAGPIVENCVEATNLPWRVCGADLAHELGVNEVRLVNDLVATGEGLACLGDEDVEVLHEGERAEGASGLLVAAGTGFGVALLVPRDGRLVPQPSEGGHADFAPRDEVEDALARFLRARHGHVSVERVVSGPGLVAIYEHLGDSIREPVQPDFARRWNADDRGKLITEYALSRRSRRAARALELFVSAYGAATGNLALACLARAGVWIAGGIAPKIAPLLRGEQFRRAFLSKSRLHDVLEAMPLRLVLEPRTAVLGAARIAARSTRPSAGYMPELGAGFASYTFKRL